MKTAEKSRYEFAIEYGGYDRQWFKLVIENNSDGSQTVVDRIPIESNPLTGAKYRLMVDEAGIPSSESF
jgi:hypothetical protein